VPADYKKEDNGRWKFALTLDPALDTVKILMNVLDVEANQIKGANFKPYKADKTKNDKGEFVENGLIAINFSSIYPPVFFDAKNSPSTAKITWGSRVRVAFIVRNVDTQGKKGLGRYFNAIRIIELAESRQDYGFGEEELGYTEAELASMAKAKIDNPKGYISTTDEIAWDDPQ